MFDFWRTVLASFGFGMGFAIAAWYRAWKPEHVSPSIVRLGRDVVLACLIAPPLVMIILTLSTNVLPTSFFVKMVG